MHHLRVRSLIKDLRCVYRRENDMLDGRELSVEAISLDIVRYTYLWKGNTVVDNFLNEI